MAAPADKGTMARGSGRESHAAAAVSLKTGGRGNGRSGAANPGPRSGPAGFLSRLALASSPGKSGRAGFVRLVGLLAAAAAFPVAEIYLFVWIGSLVGNYLVIAAAIVASACGVLAVRSSAAPALGRLRECLTSGRASCSVDDLADSAGLVLAAVLLAVPGFLTDALGGALLVPRVRRAAARFLAARYSLKTR
jgi:UPF0716 family protein affecting phage T7 exclusion